MAALGSLMSAYSDTVLATPSLRHYWKMNEASGSAADSVGGLTATLGAGLTRNRQGAIRSDPAQRFNKANNTTNSMLWTPTAAFTGAHSLEMIARVLIVPSSGHVLYGARTTNAFPGATELNWRSDSVLQLTYGNGTTFYSLAATNPLPTVDWWHHIIAAIGGDGAAELFIDGVSVDRAGASVFTGGGIPMLWDTGNHLPMLGNYSREYDPAYSSDALIQHLAVYGRMLTASDAAAHYAAMIATGPTSGQTWPRR